MFHLRWYIEYSERISCWLFLKIHRFISCETGDLSMTDDYDQHTLDQDLNKDHFEWSLNQNFTDIYQNDLGIIYIKFTPGFARSFIARIRRFIMIYFLLDESAEDEITVPSNGRIDIPAPPGHIIFYNRYSSCARKCFKWISTRIGGLLSSHKKLNKAFSDIYGRLITRVKSQDSFVNKSFIRKCIRGPGPMKLISCTRFHKRI
jgi:hypothetical protein